MIAKEEMNRLFKIIGDYQVANPWPDDMISVKKVNEMLTKIESAALDLLLILETAK